MRASTIVLNRVRGLGLFAAVIGVALSVWLTVASLAVTQRDAISQHPHPDLYLAGPNHDGGGG